VNELKKSRSQKVTKTYLWPMSDVHWGSDHFDKEKFLKYIQWAHQTPNLKIILLGDLMENAIPERIPEAMFEQNLQPRTQLEELVKILRPLKSKILCAMTGNHELRTYYKSSLDPTEILCTQLNIPFMKDGGGYVQIFSGKQRYVLAVHHGASASVGNMRLDLDKLRKIYPHAEGWIAGHNHFLGSLKLSELVPEPTDCEGPMLARKQELTYIRSGSFLKYGGYAARKLYEPQRTGNAIIKLYIDNHIIGVDDSDRIGTEL